jgi:AraC-like DNA-binding protein
MAKTGKKKLREKFFDAAGPNARTFAAMFDASDDLCFYMKDADGRIMAINRRNREVCNIRDEWDAIGLRSADLFPTAFAEDYMALDREVLGSGHPVLKRVTAYPADNSRRFMVSDVYPLRDTEGKLIGTARVYRLTSDTASDADRYGHMRDVTDFIEEHYAENISINALATSAKMSVSTFRRTFATVFGVPPGRYVTVTRLNAARRMLEDSDALVSDIAQDCGFYDQSHFTKTFLRERGVTPGEYRRTHFSR